MEKVTLGGLQSHPAAAEQENEVVVHQHDLEVVVHKHDLGSAGAELGQLGGGVWWLGCNIYL